MFHPLIPVNRFVSSSELIVGQWLSGPLSLILLLLMPLSMLSSPPTNKSASTLVIHVDLLA
jgi:hypothetical protein